MRHIVATDLMLHNVTKARADHTLGEAMQALVDLQGESEVPNALVVLDANGRYEGILTARLLLKSLLTLWMPSRAAHKDEAMLEKELLDIVHERSKMAVHGALIRGLPTAAPSDRLLALVEIACDKRLEFMPVVDDGRVVGLVPITQIFLAVASLALTPEHEGIRFDQE